MRTLLSLDLSTTCTGYAVFDLDTKKLIKYGHIKPIAKGLKSLIYPQQQLTKIRQLCGELVSFAQSIEGLERIVIEEINRSKNRLGQKVLDAFHFILLDRLPENLLRIVMFKDSDGATGWRTELELVLSDADKFTNKERRKFNTKAGRGQKLPVINKKHLACRFVNKIYELKLDCDERESDGDEADAIGLGHAVLTYSV